MALIMSATHYCADTMEIFSEVSTRVLFLPLQQDLTHQEAMNLMTESKNQLGRNRLSPPESDEDLRTDHDFGSISSWVNKVWSGEAPGVQL